jgi:MOSC domain-containing protein YiiM
MERHVTADELEAGMDNLLRSPSDDGMLSLIVRRPVVDAREELEIGQLDAQHGLVGDRWNERSGSRVPRVDRQITVMNARVIALLAQHPDRWKLAGDQLFVDLDLSEDNLPVGTRIAIGSAIIEVSAMPHTACKKFAARFGVDAFNFVNSHEGKRLRLRGLNASVTQAGFVRCGDAVRKL